ncbi:MAG: multidrug transporter, partial [Thermaurantiacus sp.]
MASLLAACAASVPDRPAPALLAGHALPEVTPGDPAALPLGERLAADPAFAPLLAAALQGSPDLEAAVARIAEARAGRAAATAALAPRVDGAASV